MTCLNCIDNKCVCDAETDIIFTEFRRNIKNHLDVMQHDWKVLTPDAVKHYLSGCLDAENYVEVSKFAMMLWYWQQNAKIKT